jgi:hypothetical protein
MLQKCMQEFEAVVEQQVELEFERAYAAMKRGEKVEIPIIGEAFPPPEYRRNDLKARVRQALCCLEWFRLTGPEWAQPLPITREDCIWCYNQPNKRLYPVGRYGIVLRDHGWDYMRAPPFEQFIAGSQ